MRWSSILSLPLQLGFPVFVSKSIGNLVVPVLRRKRPDRARPIFPVLAEFLLVRWPDFLPPRRTPTRRRPSSGPTRTPRCGSGNRRELPRKPGEDFMKGFASFEKGSIGTIFEAKNINNLIKMRNAKTHLTIFCK
jgi:hypothetical protein